MDNGCPAARIMIQSVQKAACNYMCRKGAQNGVNRMKRKEIRDAAGGCIILLFAIFALLWLAYENNFTVEGLHRPGVLLIMAIALAAAVIFMPEHNMEGWIGLIVLAGIAMRIWYTMCTPYGVRGHDLGEISLKGNGHAAYILQLYENGTLPGTNAGQFYHPPLFHMLAAGVRMTALTVLSFLPGFYLMAATVNNDSLAFCFMLWIVLCFIRWYKTGKLTSLAALAAGFGLGMMTKMSVGILAVPIGSCMLVRLIRRRKEAAASLLRQYGIFLAIAVPAGMWYPVRNLLRFGQSFTYVLDLKNGGMQPLGNISLWKRLLPWGIGDWLNPVFADVDTDYNMPEYLLKSSLFGEYTFDGMGGSAYVLFVVNLLLILLSLAALIYLAVVYVRRRRALSAGIVAVWGLWMISYVSFNIRYPYGCSMDFRYVPMTVFSWAAALAVMSGEMWKQGGVRRAFAAVCYGLTGCFAVLSVVCYSVV